jgi:hypothetical protein
MRLRSVATVLLLTPLTGWGCYAYSQYVPDRPVAGATVEITLNDLGRFSMANHIGPEVMTVEGIVASVADSQFVLRVQRVVGIDRSVSRWALEPTTFQFSYVRGYREKRFSSGKTALFAGSMTASIVAFIATRSITGVFGGDRGGPTGDGPGSPDH